MNRLFADLSFKKTNIFLGWLVWAVAAFTYCSSIEPTASFWDCGEYIACAYKLEVGHPPGAPFFLLIARVFTLFGGADPAQAAGMINTMSALAGAFSMLFLFWTITRLAVRAVGKKAEELPKAQQGAILGAGLVGSLACMFTDTFWFNSVEGEVYALSSFFTAFVFWAILKWDEEDSVSPIGALRWLVLISYMIGISIGVHLLSLLTIPAMVFVVYFKKYRFSWKGFLLAGIFSVLLLGFIQDLLIPKIVKFISDYEVFFTNKMHLGYNTGTLIFFVLLILSLSGLIAYTLTKKEKQYKAGFYSALVLSGLAVISAPGGSGMFWRSILLGAMMYGIHKFRSRTITLHAIFLSFTTLLIGYSSFFVLVIRSQANTPMDENDPENATNLLSYLLREQYENQPLVYGQYYNAPTRPRNEFGDRDPVYAKDARKGNYKMLDSRKKSVAKYEKEFCTLFPRMWSSQPHYEAGYRYWGNVGENHRNKVMENRGGEPETIEVPTFKANLSYFFRYQLGFMYLRYFFWNFVGRQNDVQGLSGNNMDGNWVSGIKPLDDLKLDTDTLQKIYRDKNNAAANHYYALPLILGLCGMFYHFKKNKPGAWIVLCFFLLTGLAITIYLNQQPQQPRERDYAYPGSFYAFAIWIGFGVLFVYEKLSRKNATLRVAGITILLCLMVPAIMAKEGWDDHDRSDRSMSRDCAVNYLQSCAPNAILFTNGDNDTFPLWYAQEVEGIRTDVRVVCLSLLSTDWCIKQVRRAAYEGKPVPFTIPEEKLEGEKMSYLIIDGRNPTPMRLQDALANAISDDPNTKLDNGGELLDILPAKQLYVDVDSASVIKNKVLSEKDLSRLEKRISWDLGGRNYILKNDLMVLDLIAHNTWERPIYFTTNASETCVGLSRYLQAEGLTYRFVPVKQTEGEVAQGGRVNTEVMYENIMHKYQWGGMDKKGIYLDETCLGMAGNLRMQMIILAGALIGEGKNEKAKQVLDKCLRVMPEENVPFDARIFTMCGEYFELGELEKAGQLAGKLFGIFENDLRVYTNQQPDRRSAYSREIDQAKNVLKNLTSLVQNYKQENLAKEFTRRLSGLLGPEDLEPPVAVPQLP